MVFFNDTTMPKTELLLMYFFHWHYILNFYKNTEDLLSLGTVKWMIIQMSLPEFWENNIDIICL